MNPTRRVLGFDTETDNDGNSAWIVQWALSNGRREEVGYDLRSFTDMLHKYANKGGKWYIYAHNLKYDWSFIRYGVWKFLQERSDGYEGSYIIRKGSVVSVTLKTKTKHRSEIVFRDSMKKIQGSLKDMAKTFGMSKLDSPQEFFQGWSETIDLTDPENTKYVRMDARIVAVAMRYLHSEGYDKATSSGDAWKTAKHFVNGDYTGAGCRWKCLYPEIGYELDRFLRPGYAGGINISQGIGCHEGPITHVDMTSMYPTCLMWDPMPYDIPSDFGEEYPGMRRLWVGNLRIKLRLKEGHVPWFLFRSGYDYIVEDMEIGTIVVETQQYHDMVLTSIDLCNLAEDYEIEEDPEWYPRQFYVWKSNTGVLKEYIDNFIRIKNTAPKGSPERDQAKRMLNSVYGRFALTKDSEKTAMRYDADLDDLVYDTSVEQEEDNDSYLPLAMFCTSFARARLLEMVRAVASLRGPDAVIHCDTDSVIYEGEPIDWPEYDKGLGTWSIESRPVKIYEGGFKRYIEVLHEPVRSHKDLSVACAGVPQRIDDKTGVPVGMWVELLDDPEIITHAAELGHKEYRIKSEWLRKMYLDAGKDPDRVNTYKLLPKTLRGGTVLVETSHKLSDNMKVRYCRGF